MLFPIEKGIIKQIERVTYEISVADTAITCIETYNNNLKEVISS